MKKIIVLYAISATCLSIATQKILMISIPKCGTHLLINTLDFIVDSHYRNWPKDQFALNQIELDNMSGPLFAGHILYNESNRQLIRDNNFVIFFIIRDPRDQCISMMYWVRKHPLSKELVKDLDDDTLLTDLIQNHLSVYPEAVKSKHQELCNGGNINDFYNLFLPWMQCKNVYTIRFESLVGKRGLGSHQLQMETLEDILNHLHIYKNPTYIHSMGRYLFGHSMTFRKGHIGEWKTHFKEHHKVLFKEVAGQLLIDLAYETNLDW